MANKGTIIGRILNFLATALTFVFAVSLSLSYLAVFISPNTIWWLSFFGLSAPVLILLNLILALYWIIKWRWIALMPIGLLVCGMSLIFAQFQFSLFKEYPFTGNNSFKVISYNVHGFSNMNRCNTLDSIAQFVANNQADIICFQEFLTTPRNNEELIKEKLKGYEYSSIFYVRNDGDNLGSGLAVFSKFPIVKSKLISSNQWINGAMWADVVINRDTIRVFNNHLQTNNIDINDREFISNIENIEDDTVKYSKTKDIAIKLKANYTMRAVQVDSIVPNIKETKYMQIVCGDFNDVPMSYAYHEMRGKLKDSFKERGSGFGHTFNELFNLLRIDYIFHSKRINTISYESPNLPYSDHNPVITLLEVKK